MTDQLAPRPESADELAVRSEVSLLEGELTIDTVPETTDSPEARTVDDTPMALPVLLAEELDSEPLGLERSDDEHQRFRTRTQNIVSALSLIALTAYVLRTVHIDKVFTSAVPTGGDMGAHVWGPAYLRDHLLPNLQVRGWTDDWYGGMPAYQYYMLPPALLIVLLDVVVPYGMAMKIVAVLGVVTMPLCAYAFGRLARFAYPIPLLFAVASTIFLHDEGFKIQGGNVASTMAGEFSFSIALSLSFLALGYFARGIETGQYRKRTMLLIALAALCHGIVMLYVAVAIVVYWLVWCGAQRWKYLFMTAVPAVLLAGFWLFPFVATTRYMTDMKYESAPGAVDWENYWKMFFPHSTMTDRIWVILALTGFIGALIRRHRNGAALGILHIVLVAAVFASKNGLPGLGLLWSTRVLPFMYLTRYMLGLLGIFELFMALRRARVLYRAGRAATSPVGGGARSHYALGFSREQQRRRELRGTSVLAVGTVAITLGWLAWHFYEFPFQKETYSEEKGWKMEWPHIAGHDLSIFETNVKKGYVNSWARWNFTGYEGKDAYGEYRGIVDTMKRLGEDPEHGCGRALWEDTEGDYGTPMALMLLPFWTKSCIGSSEGLFFESSATTPYHFLTVGAMSQSASNPVRGLSYDNRDATLGVRYMQQMGIKYYMTWTPESHERADGQPDLREIRSARSGPWRVYEVAGSDLVIPLTATPVVVNDRSGDPRERWLEVGTSYFQHPEDWNAVPAADGPPSWQRVDVSTDELLEHPKVDRVRPSGSIESKELPTVNVTNVRKGEESISFSVDQIGVPILVRASYFPNWEVSGAEGPYRIAPNQMVVIPTSQNVRLEYGTSTLDWISYLLSVIGLLCLFGLGRLWKMGRLEPADDESLYDEPMLSLHLGSDPATVEPEHIAYEWSAPQTAMVDDFAVMSPTNDPTASSPDDAAEGSAIAPPR